MLIIINDSLALCVLQLRTALFGYLRNRDVCGMMDTFLSIFSWLSEFNSVSKNCF